MEIEPNKLAAIVFSAVTAYIKLKQEEDLQKPEPIKFNEDYISGWGSFAYFPNADYYAERMAKALKKQRGGK